MTDKQIVELYFQRSERALTALTVKLAVVKDVLTDLKAYTCDLQSELQVDEDTVTYTMPRDVYDEAGNLIRTDSTEDLDEMGCGTSTYKRWEE